MSKWANECEHIFYLQGPVGYPGAVIVSEAAALRPLMSRDTPKSVLYRLFYPWLGIGLLTAYDETIALDHVTNPRLGTDRFGSARDDC